MKSKKINFVTKILIITLGLSHSSYLIASGSFSLVSEEEYLLQLNQRGVGYKKKKILTRGFSIKDKNAPIITLSTPSVTSGLFSPIRIGINFKARGNANVRIESLRILYGWLSLDITDRIKQHAKISQTGISAENVDLPVGEHNITIEIMDTMERRTTKEISIEILEP